ncbi:MAG: hypothetical protein HOL01_04800 [Planctomycetaceae bacterium]|nr:hypothetical protein [Planctomycetaceae bacterium]
MQLEIVQAHIGKEVMIQKTNQALLTLPGPVSLGSRSWFRVSMTFFHN